MFASDAPAAAQEPAIVVVGTRDPAAEAPNTKEGVDADHLKETTNLRNTEDSLRYLPSLLVRKRHIGDTQAPLATRTSGVGSSARSLVYADGILLSALIGNNNSFASPRWGMVSPEEVERVDVLYGPFSAAYPGNSIGAVVNITTKMPDHFEATATGALNVQKFSQYATSNGYPAYQIAGTIGDRIGAFSWFASANHVDSESQPLAYITLAQAGSSPTNGVPVTGAFDRLNRLGQPIFVIGAGGLEHQKQDNLKLKIALDLTPSLRLGWSTGLFLNDTSSDAQTYLKNTVGADVFTGPVVLEGRQQTIPASAFSNQVYRFDERHWIHSARLERTGTVSWSLIGSLYDYAKDDQRIPSSALPAAHAGGAGSILRMSGTGWRTLDFRASSNAPRGQALSGGAHYDDFALTSRRYLTDDWLEGDPAQLVQESLGHTRTLALWIQDRLTIAPALELTLGARYEWWKAYDGRIFPLAPPADPNQPSRTTEGLSPKASLRWLPTKEWTITLSGGRALRFPTVSELYQAVTVGGQPRTPDPNLDPERALSAELAIERRVGKDGRVRLSLFHEGINDALISQTAPFPSAPQTLVSFVQNIDKVRTNGAELVVDLLSILPRLDLSGSVTLVDPEIVSDPAFPAAEGKMIPQVPRRRATIVSTWRPTNAASLTLAGRYASKSYGTIDNSDFVGHTYQGFESYFVADARASYELSQHWRVAAGVENFTDKRYFLFHPFPGRTFTAEVGWKW